VALEPAATEHLQQRRWKSRCILHFSYNLSLIHLQAKLKLIYVIQN